MRAFSLLKLLLLLFLFSLTLVACEPQTYFRLSLRSLRKITPANPTGKSISVNVIFRRERSDDRKYVCGSQAMTFFPSRKSMQTNKKTNKNNKQNKTFVLKLSRAYSDRKNHEKNSVFCQIVDILRYPTSG